MKKLILIINQKLNIIKVVFVLLLLQLSFIAICQNFDTIVYVEKSKKLPICQIDKSIHNLLSFFVNNCNNDKLSNKFMFGYLVYSRKHIDRYSIIIMPIDLMSDFYDTDFFGVFHLYNRNFFCFGDLPNELIRKNNTDSISIAFYVSKFKISNGLDYSHYLGPFLDLSAKFEEKKFMINEEKFSVLIQPCIPLNRYEIRKLRRIRSTW